MRHENRHAAYHPVGGWLPVRRSRPRGSAGQMLRVLPVRPLIFAPPPKQQFRQRFALRCAVLQVIWPASQACEECARVLHLSGRQQA